ncbi:MAG: GDSL-type esterase/lipase family protein [Ignavibacteria bacterium]
MKIPKGKKKQILADKEQLTVHQISKKYNISPYDIKKIIKASEKIKTMPKWFYAVLVSLPIVFLIVLEIVLRIIDYGYNFDQWIDAGQGKYGINENIAKKYFAGENFNPKTSEDCFDIQKKTNSFRVFVLGGSSAEGFPYSPMGSFSRYIRRRLELVYPNTPIEVINIGMSAVNSYTILDFLPDVLDQKPDLILIYAGHNEYYGALGVGSLQSFGSSRTITKLMLYLNNYKLTQLVRDTIQWILSSFSSEDDKSSGTLMASMPKDKYILLNSEEYKSGLEQFKDNFTDILSMIKDKGVPVIISMLVSNLKDQKPFISVNTPGYKSADEIYEEAMNELKNSNIINADSLFRLAKDLDGLRFRAPEKINEIIDDLGKEFHVATVPMDSIFNSASPGGIVGDNLIVDHLHPNVKGYQLMGKAFYDSMEKLGYLPRTEHPKILFDSQDSLTHANFMFTKLDSVIGDYTITILKNNWPYVKKNKKMSKFQHKDFINLLQPKDLTDSIAVSKIEGISWTDAHLLAAKTCLKKDDIKNYLKHIRILQYQYPLLGNFNSIISYFYYRKKLNLEDYTSRRVGIIQLYRGEFDDAIKYLTEAYNSNPKNPLVLYNLSLAYSKKKDFKTALSLIDKCLILNPDYPDANELKQQILKLLEAN